MSQKRPASAFEWPPPSRSTSQTQKDFTVHDLLDRYQHDPEILKLALVAKAEEDKKRTMHDTLQVELLRVQQRELDLNYYYHYYRHHQAPSSALFSEAPRSAYQQEPHTAHPLCSPRKRTHEDDEPMSHDRVMQALKAKIRRNTHHRKSSAFPSPRSANKPVLPPIDTSVGRLTLPPLNHPPPPPPPPSHHPHHHTNQKSLGAGARIPPPPPPAPSNHHHHPNTRRVKSLSPPLPTPAHT